MKGPESSYLKGIGSVASSLPLAGPEEGSILEFFELISVWAETAHFQPPTPGEKGGAFSLAQRGVATCRSGSIGDHRPLTLVLLGFQELACGWAGHPPLLAGFQGPDWAGHGFQSGKDPETLCHLTQA